MNFHGAASKTRGFFRILAVILACTIAHPALAYSRDEVRAAYQNTVSERASGTPYAAQPDLFSFSTPGEITDGAANDALNYLNFLRWLAGLDTVQIDPVYTIRSQCGATLLAANDVLDHYPAKAPGMSDAYYESALLGTSLGNIAKFNWMRPDVLLDGVAYFARDDGDYNLATLGHRRWLLNPRMSATGFGLANAASGMTYVAMYAVDEGNAAAQWDHTAWPTSGAFPADLMRTDLAWSVSLNPEIYDLNRSAPEVILRELRSGKFFRFDPLSGSGDGYCHVSRENYGAGPCIIFRPDLAPAGISAYEQNQRWQVEIRGLRTVSGSAASIEYTCEMISLYPQDVSNVEITPLQASLSIGQQLQLETAVVPAYADDLTVFYVSDNEAVATVTDSGLVTAISEGSCRITVMSVNARKDSCEIIVKK